MLGVARSKWNLPGAKEHEQRCLALKSMSNSSSASPCSSSVQQACARRSTGIVKSWLGRPGRGWLATRMARERPRRRPIASVRRIDGVSSTRGGCERLLSPARWGAQAAASARPRIGVRSPPRGRWSIRTAPRRVLLLARFKFPRPPLPPSAHQGAVFNFW